MSDRRLITVNTACGSICLSPSDGQESRAATLVLEGGEYRLWPAPRSLAEVFDVGYWHALKNLRVVQVLMSRSDFDRLAEAL